MKTRFYILIILSCCVLASHSQTPYFNKLYHINSDSSDNERATCCIETNRGYLVAGYSYAEHGYPCRDKLILFETDRSGSIIWGKQHIIDTNYAFPAIFSILPGEDSTYDCFIAQCDTPNYIYRPMLVRFNRSGEIVLSKVMYDPSLTDPDSYIPGLAVRTNDEGSLLCCGSGGKIVTLFKFNKELEMEWKHTVGQSNHYNIIGNIIQLPDSSYIVGMAFMFQWDGDARVLHLTKYGETDWIASIDGPFWDAYCYVIRDYDSSYLAVSSYTTTMTHYGDIESGKFQVSRISRDGHKLWSKQIGPVTYDPAISSLIRLPDSSYVFSGPSDSWSKGYMFRINGKGDSLLYRNLAYCDPTASYQYLMHSVLTSDQGLLFTGNLMIQQALYESPERSWLVKTDYYGCESFGCDSTNVYILDQTTERSVCKGDSTWFAVAAWGADAGYQWQVSTPGGWYDIQDDSIYSGTQTDTLFLHNSALLTGDMTYRCLVSNPFWRQYSTGMQLSYHETPSFNLQPVSLSVPEGDSAAFVVQASGIEAPLFQWYFNNTGIEGADSNVFVISNVHMADSGYYCCKAYNSCGEVFSDSVRLSVRSNGIGDFPAHNGLRIYPNPAGTAIFIETTPSANGDAGKVSILNTSGEILSEQKTTGKITPMDVSRLSPGLYFVRLNNEKTVEVRKFVKI